MITIRMDAIVFNFSKMRKKEEKTLNTSLETHWRKSCNSKDKIMNRETRTMAISLA